MSFTLARCRSYVEKCRQAKKKTPECDAISFLLGLVDEQDAKHKGLTSDQLTTAYCEQWLARWADTPSDQLPFAVKALDHCLGVIAYQRELMEKAAKLMDDVARNQRLLAASANEVARELKAESQFRSRTR